MTTATVINTGQFSSVLSPKWQPQMAMSSPVSMASPLDKFPALDDESSRTMAEAAVHLKATPTLRYSPDDLGLSRKNEIASRELANVSKQRPRKSISKAIGTIRRRNLSVSVNAKE